MSFTSMGIPWGKQLLSDGRRTTVTNRIYLGGSCRRMLARGNPTVWVFDVIWATRQICSVLADTWLRLRHRLFLKLLFNITLIWHLEEVYLSFWQCIFYSKMNPCVALLIRRNASHATCWASRAVMKYGTRQNCVTLCYVINFIKPHSLKYVRVRDQPNS